MGRWRKALAQSKRWLAALTAGAMVLATGGCATAFLNTVEPKGGVAITRDIAYAPGERHSLDVYTPTGHPNAPVVVFIYGGNWDSGNKGMYTFVGAALARRGYLAVIPDYRISPGAHYPDFLRDNAQAFRWVKDHAAQYGGDPNDIFLMGHSAGAYDAAMLALDPRWLGEVGLDPAREVKGFVGLAGPYDFLPLESDELKEIFGAEGQQPDSQPIDHVTPGRIPPMFLAHDLGDKVVYVRNTEHLAAKVTAAGGSVETRYYKGLNHALLVGSIAAPLRFLAPTLADLSAFIDAHAAPSGTSPR